VLDLFGGVGGGIICLKRLRIAIDMVIHVEHDKVANQVYKYWHKDDGITHVFIPTFEAFESNLDNLLNQHGRKYCFLLWRVGALFLSKTLTKSIV
jgi:site-specific DNA-cytosine methylase